MKILVLNCGSSSLKYQLINMETEQVIAKGNYERMGTEKSFITHKVNGEKYVTEKAVPTHKEALEFIIEQLTKTDYAVIKDLNEINAIGHRVVHGGEKFADPVLVDDDVVAGIRECAELAPVHNMAAAMGIEAVYIDKDTTIRNLIIIIEITKYVNMVSTEHLILMYQKELQK